VLKGRSEFLSQFRSLQDPETQSMLADPGNPLPSRMQAGFFRARTPCTHTLHKDLLWLRREDPVFSAQEKGSLDGAISTVRRLSSVSSVHRTATGSCW
jgi:maltooligosyltrehalose trehalohydrolase